MSVSSDQWQSTIPARRHGPEFQGQAQMASFQQSVFRFQRIFSLRFVPLLLLAAAVQALFCPVPVIGDEKPAAATSRSLETDDAVPVTFNRQIAPLIFSRCAGCHRAGEVAPFSLLSFAEVKKRARQIESVVSDGSMPPWKPVTGHGEFSNGRRLTPEEVALFKAWVARGTPEGNPDELPPLPSFATGWQLGTPDLVVTMPVPVDVASAGSDVYLNLVLPFKVPEGKFLKAVEFRPGNRRVVHHAVLFYDTSGKAREREAADPAPGFVAVTPPGKHLPGTLAIWTPGRNPLPLQDGLSMAWPANADLVLQLHLHSTGKPETEQSSIGFHFTDEAPRRSLLDVALIDTKIDIPPGEKEFRTHDRCEVPIDVQAVSIFPHMHMIGKQIKVTALLPDGTERPLLWIDDWNFNWQDLYQYATPVDLPKGTQIVLEGTHDNSAENPHNPHNPPERVRWGEQTFNEMSIAFLNLVPVREADMVELRRQSGQRFKASIVPSATIAAFTAATPPADPSKPAPPPDFAARANEAMRKFDKNADNKLSVTEIVAATGNRETPAEIEKRLTRFDRDDDKQLNLEELAEALKALVKK